MGTGELLNLSLDEASEVIQTLGVIAEVVNVTVSNQSTYMNDMMNERMRINISNQQKHMYKLLCNTKSIT